MNGLSWLLYFADVSEGIRLVSTFGWIISAVIVFVAVAIWISIQDSAPPKEDAEEVTKVLSKTFWFFMPMFVVCIFLFVAIPQRQTFMLIAASEFGEEVLNNTDIQSIGGEAGDLAIDSMRFLREYINDQIPSNTEK